MAIVKMIPHLKSLKIYSWLEHDGLKLSDLLRDSAGGLITKSCKTEAIFLRKGQRISKVSGIQMNYFDKKMMSSEYLVSKRPCT